MLAIQTTVAQSNGDESRADCDVAQLIDAQPWNRFHTRLALLVASAIILDGFDNQVLAFVIPSLMQEWQLPAASFGSILAISLIGMTLGTVSAGILGDRVGRRTALIASVLIFGVMTGFMAGSNSIATLTAFRFVAAMAVGGAVPNAIAFLSESMPARQRNLLVVMVSVCVPLGGMIGGIVAGAVLPTLGWRALLTLGAIAPLLMAAALWMLMPESPRFLMRRRSDDAALRQTLARMGIAAPTATLRFDTDERHEVRASPLVLFQPELRRDTFALWAAFFSCLAAVFLCFSWLPTMLSRAGFDIRVASWGLAAFNFGSVLSSFIGVLLMQRFGSRRCLLTMSAAGAATAVALLFFPLDPAHVATLLVALTIQGAFCAGTQALMFALATHLYPTSVRATGTGAALGVGRMGALLIAYGGATVLALGTKAFFGIIVIAMTCNFIALAVLRRHIPPAPR